MRGTPNAGSEDVRAAVSTSFRESWFRATDLMVNLESRGRKTAYFDVMGILNEMVKRGEMETDSSHFWFRLKKKPS